MDLDSLRLKDVALFLDLAKTGSIRELARQRGESPGQISKAIRSLEVRLGHPLLRRSAQGVSLTPYATEISSAMEGIRRQQERLEGLSRESAHQKHLSIATTSFLSSHMAPSLLGDLSRHEPDVHFRLIDLAPNQFIQVALRGGFEICLHLSALDWPRTWTSIEVGKVEWQIVCRRGHPLAKKPTLKEILEYPFVYPIYWTSEGLRQGDDNFPLAIRKRHRGIETATALSAAHVVAHTDQIAFLPHLVVREMVEHDVLRVLSPTGHKPVAQPLFLSVKSDAMKQKSFSWLKERCEALLR
ncbi:MAG: LysR family transcriptional regulator [Bdellovibrionota bacterium]